MIRTQTPTRSRSLASLTAANPSLTVLGDEHAVVNGIAIDSREVNPGNLFVALRGGYFDGHAFVPQARERGAAALMVEEEIDVGLPLIVTGNTRSALALVAAEFYDSPSTDLSAIGVTGTDGKTTTCSLINDVLRADGRRTGTIGTVAVRIGESTAPHESRQTTPESLDVQRFLREMVDHGVEWAILEATSHGLDLHRLDHVAFQIAAVTNITHEHLEHHKTIEGYRRAKGILFDRVAARGGTAVINVDDPGGRQMLAHARGAKVITYGLVDPSAEIRAIDVRSAVSGSSFRLQIGAQTRPCQIPLVGGYNVENALCAAAVGLAAGVPLKTIHEALERASPVPGRMTTIDNGQPFAVIVDYAHTPESLSKILQLLRTLNRDGRIIVVTGSAGERDVEKRVLQGAACQRLADVSIFTTEDPRFEDPERIIAQIAAGAIDAGGVEGQSYYRVTDRLAAIRSACSLGVAGDVILLAGKGHERSIIWGLEKRPWDEESAARQVLCELGFGTEAT